MLEANGLERFLKGSNIQRIAPATAIADTAIMVTITMVTS